MLFRIVLSIFLILSGGIVLSQAKVLEIQRTSSKFVIDGELNEADWTSSLKEYPFINYYPSIGDTSKHKVKMACFYDDQNMYFAAILYDSAPDSVSYSLSQRDDFGNGDWFGILIDPYQNNNNGFGFFSTASGVQIDELRQNNSRDFNWNAVWKSKTKKLDVGWSVEFKIPFSAIRFPKADVQTWNINFSRQVRRSREYSTWNPYDPREFGELTQMGELRGLKGVNVPIRLSFTPYLAGSATHYNDKDPSTKDWSFGYGGGMDVKYGLNESFTLDVTLVPDFSQVRSDNQILNLSAFEVKFNDFRPFFMEGTELFSIGDLFYSRRMGDRPFRYSQAYSQLDESKGEYVSDNPIESKLINATKLSGRTKKGLGIGFFNGIEGRTYGVIRDSNDEQTGRFLTNPLTNYNVLVLSQNLANASRVSFVNTNTWREGEHRKANVSLLEYEFRDPSRAYSISGKLGVSAIFEKPENSIGHNASLRLAKVSGNWRFNFNYYEASDTYDPNDLGFLSRNNERNISARVEYHLFKPKFNLLRWNAHFQVSHKRLYNPNVFNHVWMQAQGVATFKNFLTAGAKINLQPIGNHDYFEPRVWGKFHKNPLRMGFGGFISSDYSKRFAIDGRLDFGLFGEDQRFSYDITIEPRVRVSDRLFFVYKFVYGYNPKQRGVVLKDGSVFYEDNQQIYSKRNRKNIENLITMELLFTPNMGVNLRMRHYWSSVFIDSYHVLQDDGNLGYASYSGLGDEGERLHDFNYNAFTIDLIYSWIFAPGSELNITWKQSIFTSGAEYENNYFRNTGEMFDAPMTNSISVKVLYFLDVLYFKKKNRKKKSL